jgi:hypothetical protein
MPYYPLRSGIGGSQLRPREKISRSDVFDETGEFKSCRKKQKTASKDAVSLTDSYR